MVTKKCERITVELPNHARHSVAIHTKFTTVSRHNTLQVWAVEAELRSILPRSRQHTDARCEAYLDPTEKPAKLTWVDEGSRHQFEHGHKMTIASGTESLL